MAQLRVFLSHSSADKAFADQLVATLRDAGADVWYDEHNMGAGHLRRAIMKELAERPVFIVLLSKAAFTSDWVQDECEWAYNIYRREPNRIYLPIVAAPFDAHDFNQLLYIESFHRIQASERQPLPTKKAIARALRLLELTPPGQPSVAAVPQATESVEDLIAKGRALAAQERFEEARSFFERATQIAPHNQQAWFNLSFALGELQRYGEAMDACDRALSLEPDKTVTWIVKGYILVGLKRYDEALQIYDHALALDPQNSLAWGVKGILLVGLNRYEEALTMIDHALTLDPNSANAWDGKGRALVALGRLDEALDVLDRVLAIDPSASADWHARARVAAKARSPRRDH